MSDQNLQPQIHTDLKFSEIGDPGSVSSSHAAGIISGKIFPPQQHILLYSSEDWEEFIQEWVHHQKSLYIKVLRLTGANDQGIDIAGFTDEKFLQGVWDNFQCKHYGKPLTPADGLKEIAKILWHSFNGSYSPPRKYYFIAPRECGMTLKKLLLNQKELKSKLFSDWDKSCAKAITSIQSIQLQGAFKTYVENFDFSIFAFRTTLEILEEHQKTPYHTARFGGGLPSRPAIPPIPTQISYNESRYIKHLFDAYGDHKGNEDIGLDALKQWPDLEEHFHRQREFFYHAESLRNFARDTVPPGTFEDLQSEVYAGVIDIESAAHTDGFIRLNSVIQAATTLQLTANALIGVVKVQDRKGICHQLANEDRLRWKKV